MSPRSHRLLLSGSSQRERNVVNVSSQTDEAFMAQALMLAEQAFAANEVPVGAIIVSADGEVIAQAFNSPIGNVDPTAHAEVMAIRAAAKVLGNYRLVGCTLYVTIEPCTMCVGAIVHSRLKRLVFGAKESRAGAVISANNLLEERYFNHRVEWTAGVLEKPCGELMSRFFRNRRS